MDFQLQITGADADMSWDKSGSILNNVWLSLMVRRGSFFAAPNFGSRLHLLERAKNTPRTALLAREYCMEALQWLLDTGRATTIDVEVARANRGLEIRISATQADGREVAYETFIEVI